MEDGLANSMLQCVMTWKENKTRQSMQPCLGLSFAGFKLPWKGPCVEASQIAEHQSKTSTNYKRANSCYIALILCFLTALR